MNTLFTATTFVTATSYTNEEPGMKELAHCIKALNDNGKDQLFELIMNEDFQNHPRKWSLLECYI